MIRMFFAVLALVCAASIADARPRHQFLHPGCNVLFPCEVAERTSSRRRVATREALQDRVVRAGRFIAGRLKCAVNVNAELARRGVEGTRSAWAKSFLQWGRPSPPVPGAVAIYHRGKRGGHVAIVTRVENGRVYVLNPSSRQQRWVETVYPKPAIAYRVAS